VSVAFEGFAGDAFGFAGGIDVGGVEEVDAFRDGLVDNGVGIFRAGLAAEHHAAETQRADADAGAAEVAVLKVHDNLQKNVQAIGEAS